MSQPLPTARDLADLVRLPAALTVPGDVIAGAAAAGWPTGRRSWALPAASICLYWAGMALNDYADRALDRSERPERPIPSGRVRPGQALAVAGGLTAAGLVSAAAVGGVPLLRVAAPLAGVVWAYDLALKDTRFGPAAMAAARGLDVLLGSGGNLRASTLPAVAMAAHTAGVTTLSRGEVHGSRPRTAALVTAGTAVTAGAVALGRRDIAAAALAMVYAATVGRAQASAIRRPDAMTVRRATGAGIRGMIPLQAALTARSGSTRTALALLAAGPVARVASRVVSPT
jgi:4-hydroxybenzoate polyprenyltransferase